MGGEKEAQGVLEHVEEMDYESSKMNRDSLVEGGGESPSQRGKRNILFKSFI